MKFDLVLARFHEELGWLDNVPVQFDSYVYNMGEPMVNLVACNKKDIPNFGQEPHGYLRHIIDKYEALADVTVFSQAHPHDHILGNFCETLKRIYVVPPTDFLPIGTLDTANMRNGLVRRVILHHKMSPLINYGETKMMDFSTFVGLKHTEESWQFPFGAIFAVPKRLILARPKGFYEKMLTTCEHATHTQEAALLERLWPRVFKENA